MKSKGKGCLSFDEYLETLSIAHKKGKRKKLDIHILPQDLRCFEAVNPNDWTIVTTIKAKGAGCMLTRAVLSNSSITSNDNCEFEHKHSSGGKQLVISEENNKLLDIITE